jgi:hypothetical protein
MPGVLPLGLVRSGSRPRPVRVTVVICRLPAVGGSASVTFPTGARSSYSILHQVGSGRGGR